MSPVLTLSMPGAEGWGSGVPRDGPLYNRGGGGTKGAAWERDSEDKINMAYDWLEVGGLQEG